MDCWCDNDSAPSCPFPDSVSAVHEASLPSLRKLAARPSSKLQTSSLGDRKWMSFINMMLTFFSTDLEVCSQHLNVVYVKTIQTPTSQILKYKPTLGT